jgi:hypothetical protein
VRERVKEQEITLQRERKKRKPEKKYHQVRLIPSLCREKDEDGGACMGTAARIAVVGVIILRAQLIVVVLLIRQVELGQMVGKSWCGIHSSCLLQLTTRAS